MLAAALAAAAVTLTAGAGTDVQATLQLAGTGPAHLTIVRRGVTAMDATIPDVCGDGCRIAPPDGLRVVDLDGDGEPEVVVDASTGGEGCCTMMGIYDLRSATGTYGALVQDWQTSGFELRTLGEGEDAIPEIIGQDPRFEGLFGHEADQLLPPAVFDYQHEGGQPLLRDITRRYADLPWANAARASKRLAKLRRGDDGRSLVAAYVADQHLLGRGSVGRHEIDRQTRRGVLGSKPRARAFRTRLLKVLHQFGYR